jgi:hypothetical protein
MSNEDLGKFKRLGTEQLRKAVAKIQMAVTSEDADATNWEGYDRAGLMDVLKHRWPQLQAKTGATIEDGDGESDGLTITDGEEPTAATTEDLAESFAAADGADVIIDVKKPPKEAKAKKPKAKFRVNQLVTVSPAEGEVHEGKVSAVYPATHPDAGNYQYDVEIPDDEEGGLFGVWESAITARKQPARRKPVGEARKRKISDEIIREIRRKREMEVLSYAKLAAWLLADHGIKVTGDLVRSIIIKEIYSDVE